MGELTAKKHDRILEVMEIFYMSNVVVVTLMYVFIKTH